MTSSGMSYHIYIDVDQTVTSATSGMPTSVCVRHYVQVDGAAHSVLHTFLVEEVSMGPAIVLAIYT
jgi:hypothetical protein